MHCSTLLVVNVVSKQIKEPALILDIRISKPETSFLFLAKIISLYSSAFFLAVLTSFTT
jgi:hypothetical protein